MKPQTRLLTGRELFYNRIIFVLSILGVVMAIYVLQSFLRGTPIVCINSGCELVRKNAVSYPFGIPVPAFGLVGYTFLAVFSFLRTTSENKKLLYAILGIAIFGVSFVSWFTTMELFVIRAVCTWCAVSAVNMAFIFILAIISFKQDETNQ